MALRDFNSLQHLTKRPHNTGSVLRAPGQLSQAPGRMDVRPHSLQQLFIQNKRAKAWDQAPGSFMHTPDLASAVAGLKKQNAKPLLPESQAKNTGNSWSEAFFVVRIPIPLS